MNPDTPIGRKESDERADILEERRLTRAELLAAQAARTQMALESHERHFERINGHIEKFAEALTALEKHQIKRDAEQAAVMEKERESFSKNVRVIAVVLTVLMLLASVGSILVQVLA